jgi:hypothetical protein
MAEDIETEYVFGYEIINKLHVNNQTFVMGVRENVVTGYGIWKSDGDKNYENGQYFSKYYQALIYLCDMGKDEARKQYLNQQKEELKKERFTTASICNIPALVVESRINKDVIPPNVYGYQIRHIDEDWSVPSSIKEYVLVNFYGTVLTKKPLPLDKNGEIIINEKNYIEHDKVVTLAEYINTSKNKNMKREER